jgi:uncharacterized LabA/DUF88 family protein
METKKKVIFYIDGFNFYFGLRSKKWRKYYWLDMVKFCEQFLKPHQELIEVNYFSAIQKNKAKANRQDLFFSANRKNLKFNLYLGNFMEKTINNNGIEFKTFEEKQTDVHIAVKMIRDVVLEKCDISVLISADSDLTPPIDFIREYKPKHKIFIYYPPNRFSYDLKNKADGVLTLHNFEHRFENSQLPNEIVLNNGYKIVRPEKWK